jgi:hypothetical protein
MKSIRRNLTPRGKDQPAVGAMLNVKQTAAVLAVLLDVAGAALFLGTSQRWVRRRIARGLLPHRRFNGRIFFLRDELEEFIKSLPGVNVAEAKQNLRVRTGGQR